MSTKANRAVEIRVIQRGWLARPWSARVCVAAVVFLCAFLICGSILLAGEKLTVAIAFVPLTLPALLAYCLAAERGLLDPAALFAGAFAGYNGIILLRFTSAEVQDKLVYPVRFVAGDFFSAGLASALAAVAMAVVWLLWKPETRNRASFATAGWFSVGVSFYLIGVALFFAEYWEIGGYWASISTDRVERLASLNEHLSLPYVSFVVVGIVMMTLSGYKTRSRRAWLFAAAALWCAILLPTGARMLLLQTALSIGCGVTLLANGRAKFRWRYIALAVTAYVVFAIFGQLRVLIPVMASQGISLQRALASTDSDTWLDWTKPENTEFAGPYLSVLVNSSTKQQKWWGRSYLECIPAVLPRALYPGQKPISPANQLAKEVYQGTGFASGWGYSPVAEALLNFGFPGVVIMLGGWMALFLWLSDKRNHSWGAAIVCVLILQAVNVNRIDVRTVYLESFFDVLCVVLAAGIVWMFNAVRQNHVVEVTT
jgi:hypothetical protein